MTTIPYPGPITSEKLQIWNNAAFDDADGPPSKPTWLPLQLINSNLPESLDLDSCKENRTPPFPKFLKPPKKTIEGDANDGNIDAQIEDIEREIVQLSTRLEALRIKKAERDAKTLVAARRGRIVPAKFMEANAKKTMASASKKIEESPLGRRGVSLGPMEIHKLETPSAKKIKESPASMRFGQGKNLEASASKKIEETPQSSKLSRRGMSLGPMEIGNRFKKLEAQEFTPRRSMQRCQKVGFLKLEGIQEEKVISLGPKPRSSIAKASETRIRRRGASLGPSEIPSITRFHQAGMIQEVGPKSGSRSFAKFSDLRKGIATVGMNKSVQREEGLSRSIKPKLLLFDEAENSSVPSKIQSKKMKARVVPSRYSLTSASGSRQRKWSLPEPGKEEEGGRGDNKRSLSLGEESHSLPVDWSLMSIVKIPESLPKIRISRITNESPRDSGCVKRVADLAEKKLYFGVAEGGDVDCAHEGLSFGEEAD